MSLIRNLQSCREEVAAQLRSAAQIVLCTDFDGTLTPIKDQPTACELETEVRDSLWHLATAARVNVGVVSGRELVDLRGRVGIPELAYAGNHGLEIEGPGLCFLEPTAVSRRSDLEQLLRTLSPTLDRFAGVWIQDKQLSATIHYRQADPGIMSELQVVVERIVAPAVAARQYVLRPGKMVLEIRPDIDWHKGHAVRWLASRFSGHPVVSSAEPLVIYLGDDVTDEDAFRVLPTGITIAVGKAHDTAAKYWLPDSAAVASFLSWVLEIVAAE